MQIILFYRWVKLRLRVVELLTQGHSIRKEQDHYLFFCNSFSGVSFFLHLHTVQYYFDSGSHRQLTAASVQNLYQLVFAWNTNLHGFQRPDKSARRSTLLLLPLMYESFSSLPRKRRRKHWKCCDASCYLLTGSKFLMELKQLPPRMCTTVSLGAIN